MATDLTRLRELLDGDEPINAPKGESLPVVEPLSVDKIREKAVEQGINTDPLDIKSVAERIFNIDVKEDKFDKNVSGFLERIGGRWCIYVNQYESELRKRFTIAHELGHFIKHKDKYMISGSSNPDQVFFRDSTVDPIEKEANEFAADLLMPKDIFIAKIKSGCNTIEKLSEAFELSTSAVKYRAYKLGLISEYY